METRLESEEVNSESLFVRWSYDPQCQVDDGHVTTFHVFTVFTNTFPRVDQS